MSSRKEQKEALRQERLEREQAAQASARRRRVVGLGVGGALAAAAVAAIVVVALSGGGDGGDGGGGGGDAKFPGDGSVPEQQETDLTAAAKAAGCSAEDFGSEGSSHVDTPVDYKSKPPHSGNHNPIPAEDDAYADAQPIENLVHSLEHGRIIIWFKPTVPASVKADLKALYDEDPLHVLIAPNADMPYEVAASAWTHVLGCKTMNDRVFDAIRTFRDAYRDQGPEVVP